MNILDQIRNLIKAFTSFGSADNKTKVQSIDDKKKVLFIMGATGTGKSKLSIEMGTIFPSEIINSDKIQVYEGLDIVTNKILESERNGIPHHLLAIINDPDYDFTVDEFCNHVLNALDLIHENGNLPIIVGGSNSYLEVLVENPKFAFRSKYDCCFIWVDVALPTLFQYLDKRVDEMVEAGFVDEIRGIFVPGANYTQGIRRAIGVPELEYFLNVEDEIYDEALKEKLLHHALRKAKENTCKLAENQLSKIHTLNHKLGWEMTRIDSTKVFEAVLRGEDYHHLYQEIVVKPCKVTVKKFLDETTQPQFSN